MASNWSGVDENLVANFVDELGAQLVEFAKDLQVKLSKYPRGRLSEQWGFSGGITGLNLYNNAEYATEWLYGRPAISKYGTDEWLHWVDPKTGADIFSKYSSATLGYAEFIPQLDHWIGANAPNILERLIGD
ncbi:MAG: hypothetical protein LBM02_08195 [Lachnospiraceae bacterium]|jgi:hypothetical protein|nr:hypothetical protein [Lachnospiraceae bacterium]